MAARNEANGPEAHGSKGHIVQEHIPKYVSETKMAVQEGTVNDDDNESNKIILKAIDSLTWEVDKHLDEIKRTTLKVRNNSATEESMQKEIQQLSGRIDMFRANEIKLRLHTDKLADELRMQKQVTDETKARQIQFTKKKTVDRKINSQCGKENALSSVSKENVFQPELPHQTRLKELRDQLKVQLIAVTAARVMYESNAVTPSELEAIRHQRESCKAAEYLLVEILEQSGRDVFDCFMAALKQTDQRHIYLLISCKDYNLNIDHVQRIREHYIFLLENMDIKYSNLLDEMYCKTLLNAEEYEELKTEAITTRRNEKLLSMMNRKSSEQFELFVTLLDKTGQGYVADVLRGTASETDAIHNAAQSECVTDNILSLEVDNNRSHNECERRLQDNIDAHKSQLTEQQAKYEADLKQLQEQYEDDKVKLSKRLDKEKAEHAKQIDELSRKCQEYEETLKLLTKEFDDCGDSTKRLDSTWANNQRSLATETRNELEVNQLRRQLAESRLEMKKHGAIVKQLEERCEGYEAKAKSLEEDLVVAREAVLGRLETKEIKMMKEMTEDAKKKKVPTATLR